MLYNVLKNWSGSPHLIFMPIYPQKPLRTAGNRVPQFCKLPVFTPQRFCVCSRLGFTNSARPTFAQNLALLHLFNEIHSERCQALRRSLTRDFAALMLFWRVHCCLTLTTKSRTNPTSIHKWRKPEAYRWHTTLGSVWGDEGSSSNRETT